MRDTKPLLIALLSIGLVGTWVYHLVDKTSYASQVKEVYVRDSAAIADAVRDSLQRYYSSTIDSIGTRLSYSETGNDSLKSQLDVNFSEINKLKNQINSILKNRVVSREDLTLARQKISELQQRVDDLSGQNNSIADEKARLSSQMEHLTSQISGLQQNVKILSDQNQSLTEQMKLASVFVASSLNMNAVDVKSSKEEETSVAKRADKFVASFVVQNLVQEYSNAEVMIVVIQPDGDVLQIGEWNTGNFETKLQGVKSYTRVVKFDYSKGEQKQIIFSLNPEKFQKGIYQLQIWHKGVMIGQTAKSLS